MKIASIYITKEEVAKKLGIEVDQFVFGKVKGSLHDIQFDVIIDSNAEANDEADITENQWTVRRHRLIDNKK